MMKKEIVFLISCMSGGGAERVISLLTQALVERGYKVTIIITHQRLSEANLSSISEDINVISLEDSIEKDYKYIKKIKMLAARFSGKFRRTVLKKGEESFLIRKYEIRNYEKIRFLRKYFADSFCSTVVAFLYNSIYLSLLSAKNKKIIISERGDPRQSLSSKTNLAFFNKMFPKADCMVFQSPDAMKWYNENTEVTGKIIFNPVKSNLPERYEGVRQKKIVNFCRISSQKNLHLLINAFSLFNNDFPEYELYIYGDSIGNGVEGYLDSLNDTVSRLPCKDKIHILPAQKDIHNIIKDYSMFVSSSDFEGMSNSMLESMAIGLPTICTDCPAGGARAVIRDHENGILVPVNDEHGMYLAMKEVAQNDDLAEKLSVNGTLIKEELSVDKIIKEWMDIIND